MFHVSTSYIPFHENMLNIVGAIWIRQYQWW